MVLRNKAKTHCLAAALTLSYAIVIACQTHKGKGKESSPPTEETSEPVENKDSQVYKHSPDMGQIKEIQLEVRNQDAATDNIEQASLFLTDYDKQANDPFFYFSRSTTQFSNGQKVLTVYATPTCRDTSIHCGFIKLDSQTEISAIAEGDISKHGEYQDLSSLVSLEEQAKNPEIQIFDKGTVWLARSSSQAYDADRSLKNWVATIAFKVIAPPSSENKVSIDYKVLEYKKK